MNRCMLDLETLGTAPGCVVLSIGAVMFDEVSGKLGASFYVEINQNSSTYHGLTVDENTLKWWHKQSSEARQVLVNTAAKGGVQLPRALNNFAAWLQDESDDFSKVEVWGNGSDFDQPILAATYEAASVVLPWKFWNNRCYRTLKNLFPMHKLSRVGTYHNALDDAKTQARHAIQILRAANTPKKKSWCEVAWSWVKRESKWAA